MKKENIGSVKVIPLGGLVETIVPTANASR